VEWTTSGSGARATRAPKAAAPTLSATGSAVGGGEGGSAREDDGPEPVAERVGAIVHAGGALLCPRTPGCTRPAGVRGVGGSGWGGLECLGSNGWGSTGCLKWACATTALCPLQDCTPPKKNRNA
jgi:hypothetical protein